MKNNILSIVFNPACLLVVIMLFQFNLTAQVSENYIIISGQITNNEFGNVVKNHTVYFLKDSTVSIDSGPLLTEVVTDEEGFYYDTITTRTSKGSLQVYTEDFFGATIDTVKYYRFVTYANSNILITNFDIFMPVQADLLLSRFTYLQKQSGDPNRFRFIDQTEHREITSWHWSFGDGTTSDMQHPDHTFPSPGMYKIRLTTTAMIENIEQSNTMLRVVYIADRSFFDMGGHAYAGYFPTNHCIAYLYYIDTNYYTIPVDTVSVDSNGYFDFYQIPTGNYYIKAQPKKMSEYYGDMMPTYYGDVVFWEGATLIEHDHTDWGYNIHFVEATGIDSGNGNISGNVKYIKTLEGNDYNLPAQGIDIYVLDSSEQTLISHYSDVDGVFGFPEVALGTYWLYPEVTGLNQKKYRVDVTITEPDVSGIEIVLIPGGIDTLDYIPDVISENALGFPYPNPATDRVNISIESSGHQSAEIEVFDLQGKKLFSRQMQLQNGSNTLSMKISELKGGVYFVRAIVEGTVSEQRFIVNK